MSQMNSGTTGSKVEVMIGAATRTPIGSFMGQFSTVSAPQLGATCFKEILKKTGLDPKKDIDQVIMGQVLTAGVGQAPARQATIFAGISEHTPTLTINKVCGSGLKAVMLAHDAILTGESELVLAGGQENMTLAPHLLEKSRTGYRMGPQTLSDSMITDGLWDPYHQWHMGNAGELCAKEHQFTREAQDQFATESYQRALKAQKEGLFSAEICGVESSDRKGQVTFLTQDEEPGKVNFEKMPSLKPAFSKEGTITAANASKINDGASALLVGSSSALTARGIKPLAKIIAHGTYAHEPKWFTTAPVQAIQKTLKKAGLSANQIDLWEINEAFSLVTMAAMKEIGISRDKVNVHGGAVALGHPIGASGARILTTLVHALKSHQKKYGLATLCIGGGEAVALIVENV